MKLRSPEKQSVPRFSRRWWFSTGKSFFWVAIVTILIWVYADMEFIVTETLPVTLRLNTGDGKSKVLLADRERPYGEQYEELEYQDVKFTMRVRGSSSVVTRLSQRIRGLAAPIPFDIGVGHEPGKQDISAAEILKEVLSLDKLGTSIVSASPAVIKNVHLDKVSDREVPVLLDFEDSELTPQPQPQPQLVHILVSEKRWRDIEVKASSEQRVLKTEKQSIRGRKAGTKFTIDAKIIPRIAGMPVRLTRTTVSFEVELPEAGQEMTTLEVKLNVQVITPAAWSSQKIWDRFAFEPDEKRSNWSNVPVQIAGPAKDIEELKRRLNEVQAYLVLTEALMQHGETPMTGEVVIKLPAGLRLKIVGEKPKVSFWVRDRKPG